MIVKFDLGDIAFNVDTAKREVEVVLDSTSAIVDLSDLTEAYLGILKVCVPEGVGTPPAHTTSGRAADRPSPDVPSDEPDAVDL